MIDYKPDPLVAKVDAKKGWGPWAIWQYDVLQQGRELPHWHSDRFNLFLKETAPPIQTGKTHLHSMYDNRASMIRRYVAKPSSICKVEGRCRIVNISEGDSFDD